MIKSLELKNFTAFKDIGIDFSPKINVIIGENGNGKTHLIKAAYGLCAGAGTGTFNEKVNVSDGEIESELTEKFLRLFLPIDNKLGKLRKYGEKKKSQLEAQFVFDKSIHLSFNTNSKSFALKKNKSFERYSWTPVFLPTKEVLSLVKGMRDKKHDQDTINLIFDDGYVDLANTLLNYAQEDIDERINHNPRLNTIIPQLVNLIGGRYQFDNGVFCFQAGQYKEKASPDKSKAKNAQMYLDSTISKFVASKGHIYSSGMTAEGFRKIGILHQLLSNGTISPGVSGPLFWDEPESNLNPKLMKQLVQILLELSRNGQQIILATHDYVLLKWFDLLTDKGKEDHVRYHSISRDEKSHDLTVETADDFGVVSRSAISNTLAELYDEDVKRALGE